MFAADELVRLNEGSANGVAKTKIATQLGVSHATVYEFMAE